MRSTLVTMACLCGGLATAQVSPETPGWIAFDMPGLEAASGTPVDLGGMNTGAAGARGFVRVEDGHFVDGAGQRLRLFGTNLTGDSCFPDAEEASRLARRLRQYGFNVLRLHFMDFSRAGSIWADAEAGTLDAAQLVKLDRFIASCAVEGIYVNLNLHVARTYPGQPTGSRTFTMGKTLDRWYPPYIQMQERYAEALLGRVNTVTGRRYAAEPAIACIELNNENTMIRDLRDDYRALAEPWHSEFLTQWTDWLRQRYASDEALRAAWGRDVQALGPEILGAQPWIVQNAGGAASTLDYKGGLWRWTATQAGTEGWNLQMQHKGLHLEPGRYTLSFRARSPTANAIGHTLMLDQDPWGTVGLQSRVLLTPEWQDVVITSEVKAPSQPGPLRLNLSLGNAVGTVEFADFSLRRGGGLGLPAGESLGTQVGIPPRQAGREVMRDFMAFLVDTEMVTTRRLVRFLKETLGCRMPVVDTQVTYGSAGGVLRESTLCDFIDIHGYWEHPSYTRNEKGWVTDFRIPNTTQVASPSGGVLAAMAQGRLQGRAFSVSEYNTPAPNDHGAELFPLLAVMAARQDWDALYAYTYRDFGKDYTNTALKRYFHLIGRANVLVHVPFAAAVFRQSAASALPTEPGVVLVLPSGRVPELTRDVPALTSLWSQCGLPGGAAWLRRVQMTLTSLPEPAVQGAFPIAPGVRRRDDGMLAWYPEDPDGAWLSYAAPAVRLLVGHVAGRSFDVGDVRLAVAARPWPRSLPAYACITLTALDGLPAATSRRLLLAASARTENLGMAWNAERTSLVGADGWGRGPTRSEVVPLRLDVPGRPVTVTALDAEGRPCGEPRPPAPSFSTASTEQTLWYLLERP